VVRPRKVRRGRLDQQRSVAIGQALHLGRIFSSRALPLESLTVWIPETQENPLPRRSRIARLPTRPILLGRIFRW